MYHKSKLIELFDDVDFATGSISHENGIMVSGQGDAVEYLILEYADRHDVYLNLCDKDRDILVKGTSRNREVAKKIANRKLNKIYEVH